MNLSCIKHCVEIFLCTGFQTRSHTFFLLLRDAYPINLLNAVKLCPEVCRIFCATANPVQALVARTELGAGIAGVVDGESPKGVEDEAAKQARKDFLRKIGYKR